VFQQSFWRMTLAPINQSRLVVLSLAWSLLAATCAAATEVLPAQTSTPEQLVDALNGVFGKHPGARPVHAKGVVLEGAFTPSPSASTLSKAPHLQTVGVPVTVRFSNFAGIPDLPDTNELASPHGFAVKFHLPGGSETDIVAHSFNGFPVATADEFRQLLIALGTSGKEAAKPTPLDAFLAGHAVAKAFLETPKPPPVSYATLPYFGVNTFKFTNAKGVATFGRYQFQPVAGTQYLSKEQLTNASPNYLKDEITKRVGYEPPKFRLVVQIAGEGDKLGDPSIAWPDTRRTVELGTIEITKAAADNAAAERAVLFLPGALTDGVEAADPMIDARNAAYAASFSRRTNDQPQP
jgi:catalase